MILLPAVVVLALVWSFATNRRTYHREPAGEQYWYQHLVLDVPDNRRDLRKGAAGGLACGVVVLLATQCLFAIVDSPKTHSEWQHQDTSLVSLRDASIPNVGGFISGFIFVYGSVSTDGANLYTYHVEENGGYRARTLKETTSSGAIIVYEEDRSDAVLRTLWVTSGSWDDPDWQPQVPCALKIGPCNNREPSLSRYTSAWDHYEFHVPRGTIRRDIRLGG